MRATEAIGPALGAGVAAPWRLRAVRAARRGRGRGKFDYAAGRLNAQRQKEASAAGAGGDHGGAGSSQWLRPTLARGGVLRREEMAAAESSGFGSRGQADRQGELAAVSSAVAREAETGPTRQRVAVEVPSRVDGAVSHGSGGSTKATQRPGHGCSCRCRGSLLRPTRGSEQARPFCARRRLTAAGRTGGGSRVTLARRTRAGASGLESSCGGGGRDHGGSSAPVGMATR